MGRMKSLGYAYAEYLQEVINSEDSDEWDGQIEVDQYFEDIIHGEVEIPKWFVEQWLEANPIFASEEFSAEEDYEVIMVNVNYSMERDGETFVFGDVMFGLPDNGRSRISSYGQGADKPSARQSLIERAIEHLHEDERMSAKMQQQDVVYQAEDDIKLFYEGIYDNEGGFGDGQELKSYSVVSKKDYRDYYEDTKLNPCECDEQGCLSCFLNEYPHEPQFKEGSIVSYGSLWFEDSVWDAETLMESEGIGSGDFYPLMEFDFTNPLLYEGAGWRYAGVDKERNEMKRLQDEMRSNGGWYLLEGDWEGDCENAIIADKNGNTMEIVWYFDISQFRDNNVRDNPKWDGGLDYNFNFDYFNPKGMVEWRDTDGKLLAQAPFTKMEKIPLDKKVEKMAETFEADTAANFYRNCNRNGWSVLGRTMHYGCSVFGKVVGGGAVVANNLNFYDKGSRVLRTAGTNDNFTPALELAKVSRELQPDSIDDWSRVAQVTNDRLSQNFSAETKSWRIQNRDSSGKFTKGFVEEIDIADFMELEPEAIPEISIETTYTTEQTVDFVNSMINDDDLPMRLMDSSFVNTLQSHISSADVEMLQSLNDAANMAAFEALMGGSADNQQAASRAVFVTDMLMNYKWGQDYWASEWE